MDEDGGLQTEQKSSDIPKERKTASVPPSELVQAQVAASCSAYHFETEDNSISRSPGCSVYLASAAKLFCMINPEGTSEALQPRGRYGIISSMAFHRCSFGEEENGYAPVVVILAENDARIRSLVCTEFRYLADENGVLFMVLHCMLETFTSLLQMAADFYKKLSECILIENKLWLVDHRVKI